MIKVLKSGFFTTIQDKGRFGYRNIGVPVSGVMDAYSASIANSLLENDPDDAVMEITMTGPTLEFQEPSFIAITGAEMSATLNTEPINNNCVHQLAAGDIVSFGKLKYGLRSYLAVKNGFKTKLAMGSRSFFKPITDSNHIKQYMEIAINGYTQYIPKISEVSPAPFYEEQTLVVYQGPEYDILNDKQCEVIFATKFLIAKENDRMAYQLQEPIEGHSVNMLTSATLPGTVQLTPSGKLIILMQDGQTTGGYPRILQLSIKSISLLAQKKYGDPISFQLK